MGIPGFYGRWLMQYAKRMVLRYKLPRNISSLALDLNSIFHDAKAQVLEEIEAASLVRDREDRRVLSRRTATKEQIELEIFNKIVTIILRVVKDIAPRDTLILAVDGLAPGAKLKQQRERRFRAAMNRLPTDMFDGNAITPGTDFMIRLDKHLDKFIEEYREQLPPTVIYSSHLTPGEGEHKIADMYRQGVVGDIGAHILYGLDADLIMIALLSPVKNLFLTKKAVEEVVDIQALRDYLKNVSNRSSAVSDFVVISFLLGNDFLPHQPALADLADSVQQLLDIYSKGDYVLTQESQINWGDMGRFLTALSKSEALLLASQIRKDIKYPSRFVKGAFVERKFYLRKFKRDWYNNALGPRGDRELVNKLQILLGARIGDVIDNDPKIEKMSKDYARTMAWCYLYYVDGTAAVNQDWVYPYYHTPLLSDVAATITDFGSIGDLMGYAAHKGMYQYTVLHQLISVLPIESKECLPAELVPLMGFNSMIRDMFPSKFIVEQEGVHFEHEGVVIIPLADRQRIMDAVAQITFKKDRLLLWEPADDKVFKVDRKVSEFEEREQQEEVTQREEMIQPKRDEYRPRGRGRGASTGRGFVPRDNRESDYKPRTRAVGAGRGRGTMSGTVGRGFAPPSRGTTYEPSQSRRFGEKVQDAGESIQPDAIVLPGGMTFGKRRTDPKTQP